MTGDIESNLRDQLQVVQDAVAEKWNQSEAVGHCDSACLESLRLLLQLQAEIIGTLGGVVSEEADD